MAATAPADSLYRDSDRSGEHNVIGNNTTNNSDSLEFGMSGLSLLSSHSQGSKHYRKGTDSTMSSSPPVDDHSNHNSQFNIHRIISGGGNLFETDGEKTPSTPSSPTAIGKQPSLLHQSSESIKANHSVPSPFSKIAGPNSAQHSNTSSTSPSLTLTPNSTDGSNFLSSSPFHNSSSATEGPAIPQLRSGSVVNSAPTGNEHHRRVETSSSFGSFDLANNLNIAPDDDDDNDGLFGLEALQYRAASMASNSASSPRMTRSPFGSSKHAEPPGLLHQQRRASSERPPLSHSYGETSSSVYNSDRSAGVGFPSLESPDSRSGYGAIGQLRLNAAEFDPHRRRASSQDNTSHYGGNAIVPPSNQLGYQQEGSSHTFGALPTLSSNVVDGNKPRHVRSVSQPGPPGSSGVIDQYQQQQQYLAQDPRYFDGSTGSYAGFNNSTGYPRGTMKPLGTASRSASISHQTLASAYERQHFNKNASMPSLSYQVSGNYNSTSSSGYAPLERRESLDFHVSPVGSHQSSGSYVEGLMTSGSFMSGNASVSPDQSPHQTFYGSHNHVRQQSDNVILMQSSQSLPSGLGSNNMRPYVDDDMAHPLMGEHIDVPDYDDQYGLPSYLMPSSGGASHPLLRGPTHAHSLSLDAIPAHYADHSHVLAGQQQHKVVYAVKFKRSQRNFVLGPRITRDLKIGTYVKVEADRGEDLGIVVGKPPIDKYNTFSSRSSFTAGMGPPPAGSPADLKRIMRLATHDEVSLLGLKRDEEEELLKICRAKVRQRGLPMNVVDAEYQFDRHKLTFFFEAMGRVDFRELVRDLFSMYKTRIWMQQLDKNTSTSAQAIIAPQTANMQMDYGTPIIAPPSEFADSIVFHGMSSAGD